MHDSAARNSATLDTPRSDQIAYSPKHAARLLDLSERKVAQLIADDEIESFKVGRSRRVTHEALIAYIKARKGAA